MQIFLHDDKYVFATDIFSFGPENFPEADDEVRITVDETGLALWRYSKYNQGKKVEIVGEISIGKMDYTKVE